MSCPSPFGVDPALFEAALAAVPGWGEPGTTLVPIEGGGVNQAYRIVTRAGDFLLQIAPEAARAALLGLDATREQCLQAAAARAGLAPAVIARDAAGRWRVRRYVAGRTWTPADIDDLGQLGRLMEWLRALHALPVPQEVPVLDAAALLRRWSDRLGSPGGGAMAEVDAALGALRSAGDRRRRPCIVHGDLHAGNIVDGRPLQVLDWEYAQVADPLCDLASMIALQPQLEARSTWLLEASGCAARAAPQELAAWVRVYRCINSLWQRLAWAS